MKFFIGVSWQTFISLVEGKSSESEWAMSSSTVFKITRDVTLVSE